MRAPFTLALLLVCGAACGGDSTPTPESADDAPRTGGTLVIGAPTDIADIGVLTFQVQNAL